MNHNGHQIADGYRSVSVASKDYRNLRGGWFGDSRMSSTAGLRMRLIPTYRVAKAVLQRRRERPI